MGRKERKDTQRLIAGSLVFMVAGFVFLILGRGSEPNVYQFLSIGASLIAGTLLVLGYLKERKRRLPAGAEPAVSEKAGDAVEIARGDDVEADLKSLEESADEEELQPAGMPGSEPLVSSARVRASARKRSGARSKESPAPQPAMVGAAPGSIANNELGATASARDINGASSGRSDGGRKGERVRGEIMKKDSTAEESNAGQPSAPVAGEGDVQPTAANRQWAELISDLDQQKFEPPAFEKAKGKVRGGKQEGAAGEGPPKEDPGMPSPPQEAQGKKSQKSRGLFGLFRRKTSEAPASAPAAGQAEMVPAGSVDVSPGAASSAGVTEVSPESAAEEMSTTQKEVADAVGKDAPAGEEGRPETAPLGDHLQALAASAEGPAAGRKPAGKRKPASKARTAAKAGTSVAKPRTAGSAKTAAKRKAGSAKPKPAAPKKTAKRKTTAKPKTTRAPARPRSPKGKTTGPAGEL